MIKFLCWVPDCNSICSIWKLAHNVFIPTENQVTDIQKIHDFFFPPLKPVLRFLYHNGNTASHFSLFLKLCLASVSQWISLFVITWISTALYPPPYPVVSAQTVLMAHTEVQVMLSDGCMPRAWWNKAGPSRNYAGPHVAHRLYMSATTLTITGHFKRQIKCFKPVRDIQVL